jgi:hypothetical protein
MSDLVKRALKERADIIHEVSRRFRESRSKAEDSAAIAPNSYGAGFDLGYSDALGELLEYIMDGEQ